jgi:hypothetical protein
MTVQDLLVLAFILSYNLWYFVAYYQKYAARLDAGGWQWPAANQLPAACQQCAACLQIVHAAAAPSDQLQ